MSNCKFCGEPLDKSQYKDRYKSCPSCSQNSDEHIYYPLSAFGERTPEGRETIPQAQCTNCRPDKSRKGPWPDALKCSKLK